MMTRILAIALSVILALAGCLSVLAESTSNLQSGVFIYSLLAAAIALLINWLLPRERIDRWKAAVLKKCRKGQ